MILGLDIGGSYTDFVLMEKKFKRLATIPTDLQEIKEMIKDIMKKYDIEKIGIGIAAWIRNGKILNAPNLPFKKFNLKINVPFIMENDANCFAFGASRILNEENLIGITVGTGIGMGIVIDGEIFKGNGIAGELGHTIVGKRKKCVCGGIGHLECYFSGWSIKKRYGKEAKELFERNEFPYDENFDLFCRSIANAILLFDLPVVAIGGRIGGRLKKRELDRVKKYLPPHFKANIKIIKDDLMVAKGACLLAEEIITE